MAARNTTFKLTDDELLLLRQLADDLKCTRADVLRKALTEFQRVHHERQASARAFVKRLFESVPKGSTVMIGLNDALEPYATLDGREPRPDIVVTGRRVSATREEYVQVLIVDPASDLKLDAGVIKASTGGWLALLEPFSVAIAS
jgi:hypothetical protein